MEYMLKQKHLAIKTQKTIKSRIIRRVDNMKKIKLTESDLTRIIQRIIKEGDSEMYVNYMFFSNLEQIKRQCEKLLSMDKSMIDNIIQNRHDWADDHISEAKNNMDQVFDFFMGKVNEDSMEMSEWIMRVPTDESLDEGYKFRGKKYINKGSKYKYVNLYIDRTTKKETWEAALNRDTNKKEGASWSKSFDNERDAALAVDKKLISLGKNPVNILKKKGKM